MTKKSSPSHRVAALILADNRALICQLAGRKGPGKWEFPSGHVEGDEALTDAVARVVRTRLGMAVKQVGDVVFAADEAFVPMKETFFLVEAEGTPALTGYHDAAWVALDELGQRDMWLLDSTAADILRRGGH